MNIIITGYYKKNNFGDDLFEIYADKLFQSDKFKKHISQYKIIPITQIANNILNPKPDCIVLFGGETLNNFFLDKLINIYENNKKCKNTKCLFKAIGVSCNQEYTANLINKLQLFDTIIFRSKKDYVFFKERMNISMTKCEYAPDIVLSLNLEKFFIMPNMHKSIGFFLSQTALSNLKPEAKQQYIFIISTTTIWILKVLSTKSLA